MADGIVTKERFAQLVRAGFPVNPLSGMEIGGANMTRLQAAMSSFGWDDPRFISGADAARAGWTIEPEAASVQARIRNASTGEVDTVALFNGRSVAGMPALESMLQMGENEFAAMQGREGSGLQTGEVRIGPARQREKTMETPNEPAAGGTPPGVARDRATPAPEASGRFAVMAPYWLDGLHNVEGLALAAELNAIAAQTGLVRDAESIKRLMKGRERAWMLELEVVPEERLLEERMLHGNPAEPPSLLGGALVRDSDGAYRPAAGGRAVIVDLGESIVVRGKTEQCYAAAIELALAKGWTAIELSGKGAKLSDAWLAAKIQGLDVVNYAPTVEDEKKLAERMGKEAVEREARATLEQTAEIVELRPYVGADGISKTAIVTYTVTQEGVDNAPFDNAHDAAKCFAGIPDYKAPAVIRSVIRADGHIEEELMVAGTGPGKTPGSLQLSADPALDSEFNATLAEVLAENRVEMDAAKSGVPAGVAMYSGLILRIEGDEAVQKIGRDPGTVMRHKIGNLSRMPKVGDVEDIRYDMNGDGIVTDKERALQID